MTNITFPIGALVALASWASAQTIQLPATQDNSIVLVDGEWSDNAGESGRIRIKGNQHLVAIDFDISAVKGQRIRRAELVAYAASETLSGVSISTIASPWSETQSNGLSAGVDSIPDWGYAGARFPAMTQGNAYTLVSQSQAPVEDGSYHWEIDPDLVHALALEIAHGLSIHEHDADYSRNPTIFSREQSGKRPYLLVELSNEIDPAPEPPSQLQLSPIDATSALLTFQAPEQGFGYEVWIDDVPIGRHNLPLVQPNTQQRIILRDLAVEVSTPGRHTVRIATLNRTGERSRDVEVQAELFASAPITTPNIELPPSKKPAVTGLSVIPYSDKYDQAGTSVGDLPADYRTHNRLFDGQVIRLSAAAGEVVGFQTLIQAISPPQADGKQPLTVEVSFDQWPIRIDLFQALYVASEGRQIPDPLIELTGPLELSSQHEQAIFVDLYVPFETIAGLRTGSLKLSDGRELPIELEVLPFEIPRKATFLCEMNSYGLPDHVDDYYALQQIAYDHRVHCNILHYSHHTAAAGSRKSNLDMRLRSGRRMDNTRYDSIEPGATSGFWDDFAEAFGPFLDGSYFAEGHRGPIPAPGFYLTFHESWPLNCRPYFNGDLDAYRAFVDQPVYAQTYTNLLADFAKTAEQKGWTSAGLQVYFNNKGSLNEVTKAPWILDEPAAFWDYRALQFYGELTDVAVSRVPRVPIAYRVDISRPEFCRGQLAGRGDLWVVSSWAFMNYRRLIQDRISHDHLQAWVYGTSNHVHESNRQTLAWAIDAYSHGATGLVPWQTVDKSGEALTQADQLGLFIFDQYSAGKTVIRHSTRLKAYRDAEQLIEYLELVRVQRGWTHDQLRQFIEHYVPLVGRVAKVDEADAGTTEYDSQQLIEFDTLREAAIEILRSR